MRRLFDFLAGLACCARVLFALRRATRFEALARARTPLALAREGLIATGRHLALAASFLSRAARDEAALAFCACRVLDAFEDLAPDAATARAGLASAAAALVGRVTAEPPLAALTASSDAERGELALAARLRLLREGIQALPGDGRRRVEAVVERVAAGMLAGLEASGDRLAYADAVLGAAVAYAQGLAGGPPLPPRACRACARVLQLANDLRDARPDGAEARLRLLVRAAAEAPLVAPALEAFGEAAAAGARGAVCLMALTTTSFFARSLGVPRAGPLRRPLVASALAALSRGAFGRALGAIDSTLTACLHAAAAAQAGGRAPGLVPPANVALRRYEEALARTHPSRTGAETLSAAAAWVDLATRLFKTLPPERLTELTRADPLAAPVLIGDHFLACALGELAALGPKAAGHFGAFLASSALAEAAGPGDPAGPTRLVAAVVAEAGGLSPDARDAFVERHARAASRSVR